MAKKPTAKQIAARKKFVAAVRAGKFRKGKKKPARKKAARKRVAKKTVVRSRAKKAPRKVATVSSLKTRIRKKLDEQLKDQLFKRDKATTYKQHRAAQFKIDTIRRGLRSVK